MTRLLRWAGIVGCLAYISYLASIAPNVVYVGVSVVCYVAAGYVLWRAWPAIRSDIAWVSKRRPRLPWRSGGEHL